VSVIGASAEPLAAVRVADGERKEADRGGDENEVGHVWLAVRGAAGQRSSTTYFSSDQEVVKTGQSRLKKP
jgi:hypothetical protein